MRDSYMSPLGPSLIGRNGDPLPPVACSVLPLSLKNLMESKQSLTFSITPISQWKGAAHKSGPLSTEFYGETMSHK